MYKLVLRLQEMAHNAVAQKAVGLAVLVANVIIAICATVMWAAFQYAHVRRALLFAFAFAALATGWVWLCQKVIRYMAHVYEAKLRIARAARSDYL